MEKKTQCNEDSFDVPDGVKGSRNTTRMENALPSAVQASFNDPINVQTGWCALRELRSTANLPHWRRLRP